MDPRLGMFFITVAATAIALYRLGRAVSTSPLLPSPTTVFVRNSQAGSSFSDGETVLGFPQQAEGLAISAGAARCWELMDGKRSLDQIAARIASERSAPIATVLDEVRPFAARLQRECMALPEDGWEFIHAHFSSLFAGARDEGIVEIRRKGDMVIHAAQEVLGEDGTPDPSHVRPIAMFLPTPARRRRRRALAALRRHHEREKPLRQAYEAFETGWQHCADGEIERAEQAFTEASRLAPGWTSPIYQLGYVHLIARRYPDAVKALSRAELMSPGFVMVREYLHLARKLDSGSLSYDAFCLFEEASAIEAEDPDRAIALCREALRESPEFPTAMLVLGRAYARRKEYDEALHELRRAIEADPDKATLCDALFARGSIFQTQGKQSNAQREFEKVVELNGSSMATESAMALLASTRSVH